MRVIGTAGHVDHGKSSLVRALTGTDPDRWEEERRRGMTLDLGFARLRFADGSDAGIVDVPGHERFVHNMLAGATGMDVVLLVVAANEGAGLQTLEHLAILSLLDVPATVVALTKADLVDAAGRAEARADLALAVAGTVAEDAPPVFVSTVTGEGLDELRERLHAALAALPPRAVDAPAYLPVDRAFTLAGRGTIVTGTLMQGTLVAGDTLVVRPGEVAARVRGLEVFGEARERVGAGSRVAANLGGVGLDEVARGSALVAPAIAARSTFAVRFTPLRAALGTIRRRMPVRVHVGAGETFGTLVFAQAPADVAPVAAVLHLRAPVAVVTGQRFIVRRMSPKHVLGGGTFDVAVESPAVDLSEAPDVAAVRAAVVACALDGPPADEIARRANLRVERVAEILADAAEEQLVWRLARPAGFVDAALADEALVRVEAALRAREAAAPWIVGTTSLALARELQLPESVLLRLLNAAVERERLGAHAGYFATPGHVPALSGEQRAFFDRLAAVDPAQPLVPAAFDALVTELKRSRTAGLSQALDTLIATGELVRVGDHLYRGPQLADIRARLIATLRAEGRITASRFRDVVGTSRKYVVPLLEYFDSTGVTIRDGDTRALRARPRA